MYSDCNWYKRNEVVEIRHHVTRHLEKFSLPMRRNGYFGASGQNLISPFDPGTSISCKTSIYPLSGDVFGIYLMFLCSIFMRPCDLDLWSFDIGGVSCLKLHTSNTYTSFQYPTVIRCSVMYYWIWSHFHHMERSLRMRRVTWPITRGQKLSIFLKVLIPIYLFTFSISVRYEK